MDTNINIQNGDALTQGNMTGAVYASQFGVVGDNNPENGDENAFGIARAIQKAVALGGAPVILPNGKIYVDDHDKDGSCVLIDRYNIPRKTKDVG